MVEGDAAQLEQLLINILHNAAEASLETKGTVTTGWRDLADCVEVFVRDTGPGIMNPTNLFVPFFTTKPGGSGIGLALSRQIAEAHGGSLTLANRAGLVAKPCSVTEVRKSQTQVSTTRNRRKG
jgi:signal transduction histidine kinase